MRYYVTSDIHSFYTELKEALAEKGFFSDKAPHKLVVCGDLFDRGEEALLLQEFIIDLMDKDQVILIKGNHEDLMEDLLQRWSYKSYDEQHHHSNGTINTVLQLANSDGKKDTNPRSVYKKMLKTPYIERIIPAMVDYYESDNYIFTHGWIPCSVVNLGINLKEYLSIPDWRSASKSMWMEARWTNGMEAAHRGVIVEGKTIVCGHYHCSYGHSRYEGSGSEFGPDANFTPYYSDGIIAIDGCTAYTHKVNCIVIDD